MINNPLSYSNKSWPHSSNNNQWRNFNCTLVADHVDHMGEFWRIKLLLLEEFVVLLNQILCIMISNFAPSVVVS